MMNIRGGAIPVLVASSEQDGNDFRQFSEAATGMDERFGFLARHTGENLFVDVLLRHVLLDGRVA